MICRQIRKKGSSIRHNHFPPPLGPFIKGLAAVLKFNWQLHVPHHPQSSSQVERMNSINKEQLTKTMMTTGWEWQVLFAIWSTPNRTIGDLVRETKGVFDTSQNHPVMDWWIYNWACETTNRHTKEISFAGIWEAPETYSPFPLWQFCVN